MLSKAVHLKLRVWSMSGISAVLVMLPSSKNTQPGWVSKLLLILCCPMRALHLLSLWDVASSLCLAYSTAALLSYPLHKVSFHCIGGDGSVFFGSLHSADISLLIRTFLLPRSRLRAGLGLVSFFRLLVVLGHWFRWCCLFVFARFCGLLWLQVARSHPHLSFIPLLSLLITNIIVYYC